MPSRATQHTASYALTGNAISTKRRALAPDVTTFPDKNPALIGSQCAHCQATVKTADVLLPRRGTPEAWTTQGFVAKLPYAGGETSEGFTPFSLGLVRLGDVIQVDARLTESDPAKLKFGMDVEMTMVPF